MTFNVVGNNDATGGIYQGLLTRPLEPDPATLGPVRTVGQEPETTIDALRVAVFLLVSDQLYRTRSVGVLRSFLDPGGTEVLVGGATLGASGPVPEAPVRAPTSDGIVLTYDILVGAGVEF